MGHYIPQFAEKYPEAWPYVERLAWDIEYDTQASIACVVMAWAAFIDTVPDVPYTSTTYDVEWGIWNQPPEEVVAEAQVFSDPYNDGEPLPFEELHDLMMELGVTYEGLE